MLSRDELKMLPVGAISALSRDEKLLAWQEASLELAPLVMRERDLRVMAIEATFGMELPDEGTQSLDIGQDYLCKVVVKLNYTVADTPEMRNDFTAIIGERAANVVKFKPDLSISGWKGLTQEERDKLAAHVTVKPGMPTLAIIPPGEPGNKK